MRKLTTLFSIFFCAITLMAQNTDAMLFGDVKSKSTGEHIPFVRIEVKGTKIATYCDNTGHFKLPNLPLGPQTIIASCLGFVIKEETIIMEANKGTELFFQLVENEQELGQVVVTGTRTAHFLKDVPIRTEVLTSKAIRNKNAQNLFDALKGVPGVRVEEQCQFCNFSEVRMQGLVAEHTQVLVDGQPIYSGLAGVYGMQQIGTNDVDRLEIVKGAGSALYGSSAVSGAINIITKEPTFEPSVKADIQMGNWGYKNYNASGSIRKGDVGLSVFAQHNESGAVDATSNGTTKEEINKKDGISDRVESTLNNLGFSLHLLNVLAKQDKITLRGKYMDEQRSGGVLTDNFFRNPFSQGAEDITTNRFSSDVNYTLPLGKKSELNVSTAFVHHKRNATNDTFLRSYMDSHNGNNPDVETMRPYIAIENTLTPSFSISSRLGDHNLLFGGQAYFTDLKETGLYCIDDISSPYYGQDYTSNSKKLALEMGVFIQDEWNITKKLTAVPGVRVDVHHSSENYSSSEKVFDGNFPTTTFDKTSFNPRLALKYAATSKLTVRTNVGTGFRAPYGFSEDLHLCSGSPRVWKSSNLKGESSMSFNLSVDYYAHDYQLSLNFFRTNLKDKIEFAPASSDVKKLGYTYQWENVADAYVQGVEIGVKWNPFQDLSTGVNWTFNQGKYNKVRSDWANTEYAEASRNVSRFPAMTGDIVIEYTPGTWTFSATSSLQGSMYIDYMKDETIAEKIKKTNTFMLVNFRAEKRYGQFAVYAGGKNIFSYLQDEKHTDNAAFMYAPVYGATWYAGASIEL